MDASALVKGYVARRALGLPSRQVAKEADDAAQAAVVGELADVDARHGDRAVRADQLPRVAQLVVVRTADYVARAG